MAGEGFWFQVFNFCEREKLVVSALGYLPRWALIEPTR